MMRKSFLNAFIEVRTPERLNPPTVHVPLEGATAFPLSVDEPLSASPVHSVDESSGDSVVPSAPSQSNTDIFHSSSSIGKNMLLPTFPLLIWLHIFSLFFILVPHQPFAFDTPLLTNKKVI